MSSHEIGGTRRMVGRPDGVPLGRAFLIGPGLANEPFRDAIETVARVHGDGDLPTIPVVWDSSLDVRARFVVRDDLPSAIAINPAMADAGLGLIHEIGHFLDFAAIDEFGVYASTASIRTEGWSTAVAESATYATLTAAINRALARVPPTEPRRRDQIAALGLAGELWARSYAQYVIRRSGRPELVAELDAERFGSVAGLVFPLHWGDDEFDPR